ncbi:MAG: arsenate reductase family protein [Arcobacter sp.]|mgnify:CR=1 FL=1|nr:MAG: arsenate reductase family protein [Arcobacter sp.]
MSQFFTKREILFYEKPGCAGNKKQKDLLTSKGIIFKVKNLLDTPWTFDSLGSFFVGLEKDEIVNVFAPKIKKNEIDIDKLSKKELIEYMIKEPILIKRPLIQVDEEKICGFNLAKLNKILNLKLDTDKQIGTCQSSDSCLT